MYLGKPVERHAPASYWSCWCMGSAICGGTLMNLSLSRKPTGLAVSLKSLSSCSTMLFSQFFSQRRRINSLICSAQGVPQKAERRLTLYHRPSPTEENINMRTITFQYLIGKCGFLPKPLKKNLTSVWVSLTAQLVKNLPAVQETPIQFLGREDPLEKGKATHSRILAWRIPRTVQSVGSQRDTTQDTTEQLSLYKSSVLIIFQK